MSSGPVVVLALEAPDGIARWRTLMGATDPAKAEDGTLRRQFGTAIERNATHGSDAPETAAFESAISFVALSWASVKAVRDDLHRCGVLGPREGLGA